jgi:acetoin utilization protein AcuB
MKKLKKMPIVGAVMTSFPYFVKPDERVVEIERLMDEHGIRHLPVQVKGKVVGIVSERDLHHIVNHQACLEEKDKLCASDVMVADPYVTGFNTPLNEVVSQMALRHIGSTVILRRGKLAGILSTVDVCRILAEYLENSFAPAKDNSAA